MKDCLKRTIAILLLFSFTCSIPVFASDSEDSVQAFSGTSANSYLLMDGLTGEVLSSKNADVALPMASTTKIMTCIVALEEGNLSDLVAISQDAVGVEGSSVYLMKGETLSLEELLFALMLESANDAAVAIALHISDDLSAFADLMNQKAREIGMTCTNFVNPHGLPADGHYSSARDLCKLLSYAMQNPAFRVFSATKTMTISAPEGKKRFLSNHNKLLRMYDACIGGKTGFTKEAGRCLVTAAEKNGRILVCATLGDPNDWLDHAALFNYGFSLYSEKKILGLNELSLTVSVVGGKRKAVNLTNSDEFSIWIKYDEHLTVTTELPAFVYAGVEEGTVIGYAVYSLNDKEIERIPLIAKESVPIRNDKLSFWQRLKQRIRLWFD